MKPLTKKIIKTFFLSLIALILVLWGVYHFANYYNNSIQTEAVLEYTTEYSFKGKAIVFRSEEVIPLHQNGIMNYIYEDATKVALDEPIAEFYNTNVDDNNIWRMRELQSEIIMLKEAQNTNVNNFSNTKNINREIHNQISALNWMSETGKYNNLSNMRKEITSLVNRRQIATSKEVSYERRIEFLQKDYDSLQSKIGTEDVAVENAHISGYFSKRVDGNESKLTTENMKNLKISDYTKLAEEEQEYKTGYVGKIVKSHKWSIAVVIPNHKAEKIKKNMNVNLNFDQVERPIPAKITDILLENKNDTAVVILSSDTMTQDVINLRVSDVDISFGRYSGLRIFNSNIRYSTNAEGEAVRGVFVLENHVVKFKTIDPIFEEDDYVLSRMNNASSTDKQNVKLFDQVITQGTKNYEGKPIQ